MKSPVREMFGRIAGVYDLLNHVLSLGIDRSWRKELASLAKGPIILDLAAGTLDVSIALCRQLAPTRILAMDFCMPMLKAGKGKLRRQRQCSIFPCAADALHLPLADSSVDAVTIAFGIRNIQPRGSAFQEMLRVLKPGGRLCVLEFGSSSERIWGGIYNFYLNGILPKIGKLIARDNKAYTYLAETIGSFPPAQKLAQEMAEAGFANTQYRKLTGGIVCLHWGEKLN